MRLAISAVLLAATVASLAGQAPAKSWTAPKTAWGDPDIAGIFTTDDELGVPFERPDQFGGREFVTDEEFAQRATQIQRQNEADSEEFVAPRQRHGRSRWRGGTGPPTHWLERGKPSRRTSIVVDPADGKIPFLNDAARQRSTNAVNARTPEGGRSTGPRHLDLYDRCITRGFPHVIFPTIYNNTSQIVQGPGYVAIRYEMIHDARVIPLDGSPHVSPKIRPYFGDSRGHWEGDTLVVDVTNFPPPRTIAAPANRCTSSSASAGWTRTRSATTSPWRIRPRSRGRGRRGSASRPTTGWRRCPSTRATKATTRCSIS